LSKEVGYSLDSGASTILGEQAIDLTAKTITENTTTTQRT